MTPDVAAIDAAVVELLAADLTIVAFTGPAPGGVYVSSAPQGADRYVTVDREGYVAARVMPGGVVVMETCTYRVRAWDQDISSTAVEAAALAIRQALERAGGYPITGYRLLRSEHVEAVRRATVDDATNRTWQFCGGRFDVQAAPIY
jgi:hypothetical protein